MIYSAESHHQSTAAYESQHWRYTLYFALLPYNLEELNWVTDVQSKNEYRVIFADFW